MQGTPTSRKSGSNAPYRPSILAAPRERSGNSVARTAATRRWPLHCIGRSKRAIMPGARPPVILEADGRWYVGPGNGLLELIERRAATARSWDIDLKPRRLSASSHGRDLFAPVAAMLARGEPPPGRPRKDDADRRRDW